MAAAGYAVDVIRRLGRWRSDAVLRYIVPTVEGFAGVAAAMAGVEFTVLGRW